eukprot:SAG25_NODE_156_length_13498_cov_313.643406_15_plen_97_part_00
MDSAVLLRLRGTRAQPTLGSAAIGSQWVQPLRHGDPIADVWNTRAQPTPIASSPGGGAARGGGGSVRSRHRPHLSTLGVHWSDSITALAAAAAASY